MDEIVEFRNSLTSEDSTTMLKICDDEMDLLKQGKIDEALAALYEYNDSTTEVTPLSEELTKQYRHRFQSFPVLEYNRSYYSFQLEGINDVAYTIKFAEDDSNGLTGAFKTTFMFNPVKKDGKWYLTVKRTGQDFDQTRK